MTRGRRIGTSVSSQPFADRRRHGPNVGQFQTDAHLRPEKGRPKNHVLLLLLLLLRRRRVSHHTFSQFRWVATPRSTSSASNLKGGVIRGSRPHGLHPWPPTRGGDQGGRDSTVNVRGPQPEGGNQGGRDPVFKGKKLKEERECGGEHCRARGTDDGTAAEAEDVRDQLETAVQRKKRYRSLAVVCVTGFTFNIAFSLVLTSAYPYLVAVSPQQNSRGLANGRRPIVGPSTTNDARNNQLLSPSVGTRMKWEIPYRWRR